VGWGGGEAMMILGMGAGTSAGNECRIIVLQLLSLRISDGWESTLTSLVDAYALT
jgi:hypothetical protein